MKELPLVPGAHRSEEPVSASSVGELDPTERVVPYRESGDITYRCLVEQAADAFFVLDRNNRIDDVNQAACDALGYRREELLTMRLDHIELKRCPELHETLWQALEPGSPITSSGVHRRKDGSTFPVEVRMTLVELNGDRRIFAVARDISERERVETELIEAREAAVAASRVKSEFLANMSHEIRTPMNAIMGLTDLVLDTDLTVEQQEYLATVKTSAVSLLRVIDDVLDLSKIEAGLLELENIPISLSECIMEPVRMLRNQASEKELELSVDLPANLPDRVIADPVRIRQILLNLLSNAIKFTEHGFIRVVVRALRTSSRQAIYQISVSDSGVGIPAEKRRTIFNKFAQADGSTTRRFGGTGLGLAICRKLATAMNGSIDVESELGAGSTFRLSLQLGLHEGGDVVRDFQAATRCTSAYILTQESSTAAEVGAALLQIGIQAAALRTGGAIVSALLQTVTENRTPIVLLDDTTLEDASPFLAEGFRAYPLLRNVPFVLMVSRGKTVDEGRLSALRIVRTIVKPIDNEELHHAIDTVTNRFASCPDQASSAITKTGLVGSLRILVAEDSPVNRKMIAHTLEKQGHDVVSVENGCEAVAAVACEMFDLVLMDVQMPVMDGLEATARIRRMEHGMTTHIPIIALTAHAMKGDRQRCLAEGMDDYIAKPVQREELLAGIERSRSARHDAIAPIPVLNTEFLDAQTHGDKELEMELARLFRSESPALLSRLRDAFTSGDADAIRTAAHRLKGSLSTLGAARAADTAAKIEAAAMHGAPEKAVAIGRSIEEDLRVLDRALATLLESETPAL